MTTTSNVRSSDVLFETFFSKCGNQLFL